LLSSLLETEVTKMVIFNNVLQNFQVLKEILQIVDGTTIDVTRAGSTDSEVLDTTHMFFVCFGNFEDQGCPMISYSKPQPINDLLVDNDHPSILIPGSHDSGNGSGEVPNPSNTTRKTSTESHETMSIGYRYYMATNKYKSRQSYKVG
jgi:hypothetical protein